MLFSKKSISFVANKNSIMNIPKYQKAGWIGKGLKWVSSKINHVDDVSNVIRVTPLDAIEDIKLGKQKAGSFFQHPVVIDSYAHNQALAKRLGIILPDRPADISTVVTRPVKIGFNTSPGEIANVGHGYYGDPNAFINFEWALRPRRDWHNAARHEYMHLGYYSAPIRPETMTKEYYETVYKPAAEFWQWKTNKLLKPEFRKNSYLSYDGAGEAGVNLIEIGQDLGIKLGQKYPGDVEFLNMMNNYDGLKSFVIPQLQLDTKAGRRHVWDAMTGKYFTIPAIGIGLGLGLGLGTNVSQ